MSRSHPPSLLKTLETTWRKEVGVPAGSSVGLAVSGGPDSMALLHACSLLRERLELRLCALTVDHGLRPEASAETQLVVDFARQLDVEVQVLRIEVAPGSNLQARAREARYAALWGALARRFDSGAFLATAHHKQDRAETVLLRMLRGSSLAGLAVLPPRKEGLLRPLIRVGREDIDRYLARHQVPSVRDPSNEDPRFLRVRVRRELLPLLRELGAGVEEHLNELADEAGHLPEPLGLHREQRRQLMQALQYTDREIDVPLSGGLRLVRRRTQKPGSTS